MSIYIDLYRPWPGWVVKSNEEIAYKFNAQIGTYRGHADRDPGHDMTGDLAADFFLRNNSKANHDEVLDWFQKNARRIGAIYIITWRRIWSVARATEGVRAYPLAASAPHTDHIHISYGTTPPRRDDDDMPLSDADKAWIKAAIKDAAPTANEIADAVLTRDGIIENPYPDKDKNTHVSVETMLERIARDTLK